MRMENYRQQRQRYWERENLRLKLKSSPVAGIIGGYTATLDLYSHDLAIYNPLRPGGVVLHEKEIAELEELLSKPNGNGILLVGEIGSGCKSIIYNLANRITSENSPGNLKMLRILELDMVTLISSNHDKNTLAAILESIFLKSFKAKI